MGMKYIILLACLSILSGCGMSSEQRDIYNNCMGTKEWGDEYGLRKEVCTMKAERLAK